VVSYLLLASAIGGVLLHAFLQRRASARNALHQCGRCGERLPYEAIYRVEGVVVCSACARRVQQRFRVGGILLMGVSVTGTLAAVSGMIQDWRNGSGLVLRILGFILLFNGVLIWVWRTIVQQMRGANAEAEERELITHPRTYINALRVRDALLVSGAPECEWREKTLERVGTTPWWRSRRLNRELASHEAACVICRQRQALVEAALIMVSRRSAP
jgi:hypothetical protein